MIFKSDKLEYMREKMISPDLYVNGYTDCGPLHHENWRTMRCLVFDTETNGFPFEDEWEKTLNSEFRILSFYGHIYDDRVKTGEVDLLFNPEMSIDPSSTAIHGITDEMVEDCPTFKDKAKELITIFNSVDFIFAYNAPFDINAVNLELTRNGYDVINKPFIDLLTFERERRDRIGSGNKLSDISKRFGVATMGKVAHGGEKLHDASTDVRILDELIWQFAPLLPYTLGRTVEKQAELREIHLAYLENKYRK